MPRMGRYLWATGHLSMLQIVDRSMKMRLSATLFASCILMFVICLTGCKRKTPEPVIVNILRDGKSEAFGITERKLLSFQSRQPMTLSGKPIIIQSILFDRAHFEDLLADEGRLSTMKPDLVVFDSVAQAQASPAVRSQPTNLRNACGADANCPTFIPRWVSGEHLDAGEQLFRALVTGSQ